MTDNDLTLARHYLQIDQPERALDALGSARSTIDDGEFWCLRALALIELDRHDEAADMAARGLGIDPDDVELLLAHALAETGRGDLAAAERSLLAALRIDPEEPSLLAQYAILVARAGQLEKARRLLDEGARLDPTAVSISSARGVVAYLAADDDEALRHAEQILGENPESAGAHLLRGSVLAGRGQARAARRHFDLVARSDPSDHEVVRAARLTRHATHPLLWPLIPISRYGPAKVWLAAITLIGGSYALGIDWLTAVFGVLWFVFVVYSWVVPPLVKWWLGRFR